jgi:hypothetical protein
VIGVGAVSASGRQLLSGLVRPVPVVVGDVLAQGGEQVPFAVDEDVIQALAAGGTNPALRECVSTSPQLVAVEARKAAGGLGSQNLVDLSDLDLPTPPARDPANAAPQTQPRPAPSMAAYDELLTHQSGDDQP